MDKPESVSESEMHRIRWDFEMQTDHIILARRLDRMWYYEEKNNLQSREFFCSAGQLNGNKRKQKDRKNTWN